MIAFMCNICVIRLPNTLYMRFDGNVIKILQMIETIPSFCYSLKIYRNERYIPYVFGENIYVAETLGFHITRSSGI